MGLLSLLEKKKILAIHLLILVLLFPSLLYGQQKYFRVLNGIPHLPVFDNVADAEANISTPEAGMFFFSKVDDIPLFFNGTSWVSFCNEQSWTGGVDHFKIESGIPFLPLKTTAPGGPPAGTMFFSSSEKAMMVADGGRAFRKVSTMNTSSSAFTDAPGFLSYGGEIKTFRLPILTSLPITGVELGAICIDASAQNIKFYGGSWKDLTCGSDCGGPFTVVHLVANGIAPVDKTLIYDAVTNIPGEPTKCWTTKNLGADRQGTAYNDATEASAGWYWQTNRKQGYKHDGSTRTPSSAWATSINENIDWLNNNDPCVLELSNGWRLPTYTEWYNVDFVGGWTTWNGPWNSDLKLHAAGYLSSTAGSLLVRGTSGYYASKNQTSVVSLGILYFSSGSSEMLGQTKSMGFSVRCIKDPTQAEGIPAQPGQIYGATSVCSSGCYEYTIDPVDDATEYIWIFSGNGKLTIKDGGLTCELCPDNGTLISAGTLSVFAKNDNGTSIASTFSISLISYGMFYGSICQLYDDNVPRGVIAGQTYDVTFYIGVGRSSPPSGSFYVADSNGVPITADLVVNSTTGQIDVSASKPGSYNVCFTDLYGCYTCASVVICASPETPSISYPETTVCAYPGFTLLPTVSPAGGKFTYSPSGLAIGTGGVITPANSDPGTYTITYTPDPDCCPDIKATTTLTILALPEVSAEIIRDADCSFPTADASITIKNTSSASPTLWTIYDSKGNTTRTGTVVGDTSFQIYGLAPGTYTCAIFNYGNSCGSKSATLVVTSPSPCLKYNFVSDCINGKKYIRLCLDELDTDTYPVNDWKVEMNGQTFDFSSATDKCIDIDITTWASGDYTIVAYPSNDPGYEANLMVKIEPLCCPPSADVTSEIDCKTMTGVVTVCVSTLPGPWDWDLSYKKVGGTATTLQLTDQCKQISLPPGTYSFTITDRNAPNCPPQTKWVTLQCPPDCGCETPSIAVTRTPTCDDKTGDITFSNLPATGTWTINPGNIQGTGTSYTMSVKPGTYTYRVTSADGCVSNSVTIKIECPSNCTCDPPDYYVMRDPDCINKTQDIVLTGLPSNWTINPGGYKGNYNSYPIYALAPGTHTFTVTDVNGCASAEITITVLCPKDCGCETPIYTVEKAADCDNKIARVRLENLPGGNWTIEPGGYAGSGTTITIDLPPGTYTVTDEDGCISRSFIIECPENCKSSCTVPTYSLVPADCDTRKGKVIFDDLPTGTWTITVNPGGITYRGTGTSYEIELDAGQTYNITVKDEEEYVSFSESIKISAPNCPCDINPTVNVTQPVECGADGIIYIGNLPTTGWIISGDLSGSGYTPTTSYSRAPGTYTFRVYDMKTGCLSVPITVTINCPSACIPATPEYKELRVADCNNRTGDIEFYNLPSGSWTLYGLPSGTQTGSGSTMRFYNLPAGTYTIVVANSYGCGSAEVTVVISCPLNCECKDLTNVIIVREPDCTNKTADIYFEGLPSGNWTIEPGGYTGSGTSGTIWNVPVGDYYFSVTDNDQCCRSYSVHVEVKCPSGCDASCTTIVSTAVSADCSNEKMGSIILTGLPSGGWTIHPWNILGSGSTYTISNLRPGTYTFTVVDKDGNVYSFTVTIYCIGATAISGGDTHG